MGIQAVAARFGARSAAERSVCSKSHWLMMASSARERSVRLTLGRVRLRRSMVETRGRALGEDVRVGMTCCLSLGWG
jgi:ATPase subunit of ABC transporter with duplicated ATPase domains